MTSNALSPVEQELVDAVKSGHELDLTHRVGDRVISASALQDILLGEHMDRPIPHSLRLRGATIKGDLDLTGVQSNMRLILTNCRLTGRHLNGSLSREVTLTIHWGGPSKSTLEPILRAVSRIVKQPALTTAILFAFLVAKVMYVARGDITTALGVYDSAGLTTVIVGGLLSSMPLVAAGVLGIAIFELIIQVQRWVFGLALLAAGACFFLASWEITGITVILGVLAGLIAGGASKISSSRKFSRILRRVINVGAPLIFISLSFILIVQPIMYAVWLPHEQLMLKEGHTSPEVGYVLDNSNGWVSLLRTGSRRIVRIPSDLVMRRSLCHVEVAAGSVALVNNPNTFWQNLSSIGRRRFFTPSGTDPCRPGQSGSPSSAG
jgi:hypothetical protein